MTRPAPAVRSLVLGTLAVAAAAVVWFTAPHRQELSSVWVLLGHLVPFVLAAETIASLRPEWFDRWRLRELAQVASFAVVFCFFVPSMFRRSLAGESDQFYYLMLTLVPLLILAFCLHMRLAGGRAAAVRRAAYANILIMLSGIEDAMFWLLQGKALPARWDWAAHITVFLGHVASRNEALAFIAVHLVLAALVFLLPDSFWRSLGRALDRRLRMSASSAVPDEGGLVHSGTPAAGSGKAR